MGRLADALTLSKSGATRLIDRLVDDGLVARVTCSSDLRGAEAALTEAGLSTACAPPRRRTCAASPSTSCRRSTRDDIETVERTMNVASRTAPAARGTAPDRRGRRGRLLVGTSRVLPTPTGRLASTRRAPARRIASPPTPTRLPGARAERDVPPPPDGRPRSRAGCARRRPTSASRSRRSAAPRSGPCRARPRRASRG